MTLVRPSMTNLEMTVRADCAVSACSPLPLSIKVLAHWLSVGWSQLWTDGDALTFIYCLVAKHVTLCDLMDCSLPDSSVHGIFQKYWGGFLFPSSRNLSEAGVEPTPPALMGGFWADSLPLIHHGSPLPPSPPPFLASKIRQTFLSINMTSLMAFEREAARP